MLCCPFHHKAQRSRRDRAIQDRQSLNVDLHCRSLVRRMEMRRIVVRVVESDHDAEEAAEFWHGGRLEIRSARQLIWTSSGWPPIATNPQPLQAPHALGWTSPGG